MRVLFIVPYPTQGPSNRYRVEQYLPFLKEEGIDYFLRPFIQERFFEILYKKGNIIRKIFYFLSASVKRFIDVVSVFRYDLIFVHLESFPFGPAVIEWLFSKVGKPIIYDFEDAIYLADFRGINKITNFLRCTNKFYQILRLSKHIIVCNSYMREFVSDFNPRVTVLPTSIDTDKFKLKEGGPVSGVPVIGWIGSHSTFPYLRRIFPVFERLGEKYRFRLIIIGSGLSEVKIPGVEVINEDWSLQREVDNFRRLDIGVYPLPDNEESKAKTPFKTIQYMSVGIPVVATRIGGNTEIIQDGVNSFLVSSVQEWIERLSLLIKDPQLRRKLGVAGRKTVEERYSLKKNAQIFLNTIKGVYKG